MPDPTGAPHQPVDAPHQGDPVADSISPERPGPLERRLLRLGWAGWAFVGVAAALTVVGLVASRLALVIVPVVLALFPATLLLPVANWLKHRRWPPALAALVTLSGAMAIVGLVIGLMVPLFVAQFPELAETAGVGLDELDEYLTDGPFGLDLGGLAGVVDRASEQFDGFGTIAGPILDAATAAFHIVAGSLLLLVVLFFFLKDGSRIGDGMLVLVPAQHRQRTQAVGRQAFATLGAFFRGQLLIALVDAIGIGIGLVVLRVPLALPLAVIVFFGGLFPIVGAVTAGILAVLVALAHGGLGLAFAVTALIVGVQQLEGNILEPLILSRAVRLSPLIVVLVITAGAVTLGVLGAFLAVPLAAVTSEAISSLRDAARPTHSVRGVRS